MSKRYKFKYPILHISDESGYYTLNAKNNTEAEEYMLKILEVEVEQAQEQLDWYKREYFGDLSKVERVYS